MYRVRSSSFRSGSVSARPLAPAAATANLPGPLRAFAAAFLSVFGVVPSIFFFLLTLLILSLVIFVLYWIASVGTPMPSAQRGLIVGRSSERFARGGFVGLNAGINLFGLLAFIASAPGGVFVAWGVAGFCFPSCFLRLSNIAEYQTVLGYVAVFLPMTLAMNFVGFMALGINTVASGLGVSLNLFGFWTRATSSCTAASCTAVSVRRLICATFPWRIPTWLVTIPGRTPVPHFGHFALPRSPDHSKCRLQPLTVFFCTRRRTR